jgi:hypothetical protein
MKYNYLYIIVAFFIINLYCGFASIGDDNNKCFYKYGKILKNKFAADESQEIIFKDVKWFVKVKFIKNKSVQEEFQLINSTAVITDEDKKKILAENGFISEGGDYKNPNNSYFIDGNKLKIWNKKFGQPLSTPTPTSTPTNQPKINSGTHSIILSDSERIKMLLFLRKQNVIDTIRDKTREKLPDMQLIEIYNEAKKVEAINNVGNKLESQ